MKNTILTTDNKIIQKPSFFQKLTSFTKNPYNMMVLFVVAILMVQILGIAGLIRPSNVTFFTSTLIFFIAAMGFTILLGYAGLASLGTAGFLIIGTFSITILNIHYGFPIELAVFTAIALSLVLGLIIGFISLRIEGMYLAIVTLGISEIILDIVKKWDKAGAGNPVRITKFTFFGIPFSQFDTFSVAYYVIVLVIGLLMFVTFNMINSPTGRAMLGLKNSTSAAQAMGVSLVKYRLTAFMFATFTAGVAGVLNFFKYHQTNLTMGGIGISLNILAAVVIGGMKSSYGVFAGTFIVFSLNDLLLKNLPFFNNYPSAFYIVNGALIILMVMFYPGGITRLFTDLKNLFKKLFGKIKVTWKEYRYGKDSDFIE